VMVYAIQGGLSADEILGRTRGSLLWGLNYGLFVVAASIHAAIGLRVVVHETLQPGKRVLDVLMIGLAGIFLLLGGRAVYAVVLA